MFFNIMFFNINLTVLEGMLHVFMCIIQWCVFATSLSLSLSLSASYFFLLRRLVDKARHRQQAISRASASVTDRVFEQQNDLKRNFIDYVAAASTSERDMLHQWRSVIQLNTHPRLVCHCEVYYKHLLLETLICCPSL